MQTSNPVMRSEYFEAAEYESTTMTVQGTAVKTVGLLFLLIASAGLTWYRFSQGGMPAVMPWMMGGLIVGLIFCLITCFKVSWAPVTAPVYALAEGLFLGGLSAMLETRFPNIALQAMCLTFGTLFTMLFCYQAGLIQATERFKAGIMAAMGAVFLVYLVSFVMSFFGAAIPYIHEGGVIGIGFSLVVVVIAALALVLDFDFIESQARAGAPKSMEWYGAFGLVVGLVWLYIEILRLLAKLRDD